MGGKYEGMGTAYSAVLGDYSFLDSNPAGSAVLEYTELALLHNNLIADANLEGVFYSIRKNNLGFGVGAKFSMFLSQNMVFLAEREGGGYYSETLGTVNVSYNFFSSYNFWSCSRSESQGCSKRFGIDSS